MALYFYRARTFRGDIVEGRREAGSERELFTALRSEGFFPIVIREEKVKRARPGERAPLFAPRIGLRDIAIFSRQFATMIRAGMTIVASLDVLIQQTANRRLRFVLRTIKRDVEEGASLTEAMYRHRDIFSELYVSLIRAGEAGGVLDDVLDRLASYLERETALIQRVKSAMRYPIFVLTMAAAVITLLVVYIVPKFIVILKGLNIPLPLPTQLLISFTGWVRENIYYIFLTPVIVWVTIRFLRRSKKVAYAIDRFKIKLPIVGPIAYKVAIVRFTRTLGTLTAAAVPILESLEIVSKVAGNEVLARAIDLARYRVQEGQGLAESLAATGIFPPMVIHMTAVGEETGNLDEMLHKIADFYDEEVDNAVRGLSALIEPILILGLGGVVGFIAISVFLPLFQLIGGLSR